jgi:hypothetical protein
MTQPSQESSTAGYAVVTARAETFPRLVGPTIVSYIRLEFPIMKLVKHAPEAIRGKTTHGTGR